MSRELSSGAFSANISWVTVGVADMAVVRELWIEQLGLEIAGQRVGPDPGLAALWGIAGDQIVEQLLLQTPGAPTGRLHFVQFRDPAVAVREGALPTDPGAKNLDVNCVAMSERVERLQSAGYQFRSVIGEYEFDGIEVREVQMPAHDALNLVLIEVLSKGFEVPLSSRGYAGLTSFVVIVPDVAAEERFYRSVFGMQEILTHKLSGKAIETAAGLPAGTVLDLHLLGDEDNLFGRMELIEYVGVDGESRFERAVPPAAGILRCGFIVPSREDFVERVKANGCEIVTDTRADTLVGSGRLLGLVSPAGLQLDVLVSD